MKIIAETSHHAPAIEALLDAAFGPERAGKTVYRLRDGVAPEHALCLVAESPEDGHLKGSLRYWPVTIADPVRGQVPALLLGPLAVEGGLRKTGVGTRLILESLGLAKHLGHRIVLLVGDEPYYGRFGFRRALAERLTLPGPVDLARFLALELEQGALEGVSGMVERAEQGMRRRDRMDMPRTGAAASSGEGRAAGADGTEVPDARGA